MIRLVRVACSLDSLPSSLGSRKFGQTEQARGQALSDWCRAEGDWDLEVVERDPGVRGREHPTTSMGD